MSAGARAAESAESWLDVGAVHAEPGTRAPLGPSRLHFHAGRIAAITPLQTGPDDAARNLIAFPAPTDAHDHGRGLRTVGFGAVDAPLESWIAALSREPRVDPYLRAAVAFASLAEGGACAVNHCHNTQDGKALFAEAAGVARAARDVGIRVAFAVPFAGANPIVYGDLDTLLKRLPPGDRAALNAARHPSRTLAENLALTERIAELENPFFSVQYGPVGPQWVDRATLEAVAHASRTSGRRVHMHLFETRLQREWSDAHYGDEGGLIAYLERIGLLSPRLTLAHGVWLNRGECERLAAHGVSVSINASSNLRLRSGFAPFRDLIETGVTICVGLDGMSLDDDDDLLREMRLLRLLAQANAGAVLDIAALFRATCRSGRRTIVADEGGVLEVGMPADILVIDRRRAMADHLPRDDTPARPTPHHPTRPAGDAPVTTGDDPVLDRLFTRLRKADIDRLVVAGRTVVARGVCRTVDRGRLQTALLEQANDALHAAGDVRQRARDDQRLLRLQQAMADFYACGCHRIAFPDDRPAAPPRD